MPAFDVERRRHGAARAIVTSLVTIGLLAQGPGTPQAWLGTWKLDLRRSRLDERVPQIKGQLLRIEAAENVLILTAETILPDGQVVSEVSRLKMNGEPTPSPAGATVSFTRIGDQVFEVIVRLKNPSGREAVGTNRFEFSATGRLLTETNTQTFNVVPDDRASTDKPVISVLVFERQSS